MDSWLQILEAYPVLRTAWDSLCVIVPLSLIMAYSGMLFISATAKILAGLRKRTAFDKCARQLAHLGIILGWLLLIGIRVWLYLTRNERQPDSFANFVFEMSWMLLSLGVLLSSVYYTLWRILKNMPILHATLGMISAAQNCVALAAILFSIRLSAAMIHPEAATLGLPDLFPSQWNAPFWSAACMTAPLLLAMPGSFGTAWLAVRRKRDDFGRDYYNAMLPWCAAWARNAWSLLWLLLLVSGGLEIWRAMELGQFDARNAIFEGCRALLWLLPVIFWTIVHKSRPAMRHKFLIFLALLLSACFMVPYFLELAGI